MFQRPYGVNIETVQVALHGRTKYLQSKRLRFRSVSLVVFFPEQVAPGAKVLVFRRDVATGGRRRYQRCVQTLEMMYLGGHNDNYHLVSRFGTSTTFVNTALAADDFEHGDTIFIIGAAERGITRENVKVYGSF